MNEKGFFTTAELTKRLEQARQRLHDDAIGVLITGDTGSGKSCFIQQLVASLPESWKVFQFPEHLPDNRQQALRKIFAAFVPDPAIRPEEFTKESITDLLTAERQAGYRLILIVDDAARVQPAVLDLLFELAVSGQRNHGLQLVFTSKAATARILMTRLSNEDRTRNFLTIEVPPLTLEDTLRYVEDRRTDSLPRGNGTEWKTGVELIYYRSGGLPGLIDKLIASGDEQARQASEQAAPQAIADSDIPWQSTPTRTMVTLISVVAALLMGGFILYEHFPEFGTEAVDPVRATPAPQTPVAVDTEFLSTAESAAVDATDASFALRTSAVFEPDFLAAVEDAATDDESTADWPAPAAPAKHADVTAPVAPLPIQAAPSIPVATPIPVPVANDDDWLTTRPPAHYTVQLFGAHDLDRVQRIAADVALEGPRAIFHTTHNDREWHVLVWRDFPDSEAARAAARQLPEHLLQLNPWPRPFASLK